MADGTGNKGFIGTLSAGPLGTVVRLLWFILLCLILFILGLVKGNSSIASMIFFSLIWMCRLLKPDYSISSLDLILHRVCLVTVLRFLRTSLNSSFSPISWRRCRLCVYWGLRKRFYGQFKCQVTGTAVSVAEALSVHWSWSGAKFSRMIVQASWTETCYDTHTGLKF